MARVSVSCASAQLLDARVVFRASSPVATAPARGVRRRSPGIARQRRPDHPPLLRSSSKMKWTRVLSQRELLTAVLVDRQRAAGEAAAAGTVLLAVARRRRAAAIVVD